MLGVYDMAALLQRDGAMVRPLRDTAMFGRVFLQLGVPTWPNAFAIDVIMLHDDMKATGVLASSDDSVIVAAQ